MGKGWHTSSRDKHRLTTHGYITQQLCTCTNAPHRTPPSWPKRAQATTACHTEGLARGVSLCVNMFANCYHCVFKLTRRAILQIHSNRGDETNQPQSMNRVNRFTVSVKCPLPNPQTSSLSIHPSAFLPGHLSTLRHLSTSHHEDPCECWPSHSPHIARVVYPRSCPQ